MLNMQALIGTMLGNCILQKLIAQSETAAVFLAERSRSHRLVAVKVFMTGTAAASPLQTSNRRPIFLEKFRQEITAITSLKHQNILSVYEFREQNGFAYLVMPYINGETLQHVLEREGPLALPRAATYLDQLAAALDYAHGRNVIHQNIKPTNILITSEGSLLLADFGLGMMVAERHAWQMRLLQSGMPVRVLEYLAPEQLSGNVVDVRTDLYTLGVILYQMVTGKTPFQGEAPPQVAKLLLDASPPSPRLVRRDLPAAAEQVMLQAMAKRPLDRYTRAQDFANAFRVALTATGMLADFSGKEIPPGDTPTSSHLTAPRPRGLFDPVWQKAQGGAVQATDYSQGRSKPTIALSDTRAAMLPANGNQSKTTGLLSSMHQVPSSPTAQSELHEHEQSKNESATPLPAARNTPLSPMRSQLGRRTNILRPLDEMETSPTRAATNDGLVSTGIPSTALPVDPYPSSPFPASNVTRKLSEMPGEPGNTDALSAAKSAVSDPISPFPAGSNTTGALMLPGSEQSTNGTIKLTGAVKVVQVPVAGQPGRYVTGFLPVLPSASPTQKLEEPPVTIKSRALRIWSTSTKLQKAIALTLLIMLVFSAFGTFLFFNAGSSSALKHGNLAEHLTPDLKSILAAKATATAAANFILRDPLNQNIHNWPVASSGNRIYAFKDGAYHITDNDSNQSAPAILPEENLKGPMAYTLTMEEITGNESSINNSFGMILRFNSRFQGGRNIITFYSFEVVDNPGGQYQFWKYDNSGGPSAKPWTSIWHQDFGNEFHQGVKKSNTFKVFMDGPNFTFTVNGKSVGSTHNSSLSSGEVGMLVNLQGTEIAFSDLMLTNH